MIINIGAAGIMVKGISHIEKAISINSNNSNNSSQFLCIWKLLGDLCCFSHFLSTADVSDISIFLNNNINDNNDNNNIINLYKNSKLFDINPLINLLQKGREAYSHIIQQLLSSMKNTTNTSDSNSDVVDEWKIYLADSYYDYGLSFYYEAKLRLLYNGQGTGEYYI